MVSLDKDEPRPRFRLEQPKDLLFPIQVKILEERQREITSINAAKQRVKFNTNLLSPMMGRGRPYIPCLS